MFLENRQHIFKLPSKTSLHAQKTYSFVPEFFARDLFTSKSKRVIYQKIRRHACKNQDVHRVKMKRNNNIWRENMLSERRGKEESKEREME